MSERLANIKSILTSSEGSRLRQIRQQSKIDLQELKDIIFSPGSFNRYIKPTLDFVEKNRDVFTHQSEGLKSDRKQSFRMAIKAAKNISPEVINDHVALAYTRWALASSNIGIDIKLAVHYSLYLKCLQLFGNNQTHKQLIQAAAKLQDIGCFALTQFHHGSYSKGIQTQAVYDHITKSFILNTQGTKGMKFWIGGAAEFATVAVVWAQLIVNGQSQGPHPFVMRLRSATNHQPMPGVIIGDCGPKNGMNQVDNGYIILDDVRIPYQNLLGKYGSVNSEGKYYSRISDKERRFGLHMSGLSKNRGAISFRGNLVGLSALTIALRYACTRKQFETYTKDDQIRIIDYPITQIRLIPNIATVLVQLAVGNQMMRLGFGNAIDQNDPALVAQFHAISAAMKARCTNIISKVAAECRTILGGHGYSALSRLNEFFHIADVFKTWEGDNTVILIHTSKFLMKTLEKKSNNRLVDLNFVHQKSIKDFQGLQERITDINIIESLMQDLFRCKFRTAQEKIAELRKKHQHQEQIDIHFHAQAGKTLALAFADYYVFATAQKLLVTAKNQALNQFLTDCLRLWAFSLMESERYGPYEFRKVLQKEISRLSLQLVNGSVVATDALSPSSFVLGSAFGDFEGEGFKQYINSLFTRKDAFTRASYYEVIKSDLLK